MRTVAEITNELLILENTKEVIVLAWDNGRETRYVDQYDSKNGTAFSESAMFFDNTEEAEAYKIKKEYVNCYVTTETVSK